ncbi:radical SAM protein [Paraburkholderia sp. BR10923]|uniref:radical SAM protein n=1 Tax=Paraburkholderia sp. BR10923 TaxID=3236992 RepID=UPI0034CFAD83
MDAASKTKRIFPISDVSLSVSGQIALCVAESNEVLAQVYVDISYSTQQRGSIEFCGGAVTSALLTGGPRLISVMLPRHAIENGYLAFRSSTEFEVISAVVRKDFYDFLQLNQSGANQERLAIATDRSGHIPLSIQWFVTWHCNYSCEYCWQEVESDKYRIGTISKTSPREWAESFNRLNPAELFLSGGEPSLYKALPEFISLLDRSIELVMHSNLGPSFSVEKFIEFVALDRFKELTFSFHPSQTSFDDYFAKLERLAKAGFRNLKVEMVLYPPHLEHAQRVYDWCEQHRVELRFDPYTPAKISMLQRTPGQIEQMKVWTKKAAALVEQLGRKEVYQFEHKPYWGDEDGSELDLHAPIYCSAGSRRINVDGDGNAYTCMSAIDRTKLFGDKALPHYASIGNVLESGFQLLEKPIPCWEAFRCSACDFQVLDSAWVNIVEMPDHLPIPE